MTNTWRDWVDLGGFKYFEDLLDSVQALIPLALEGTIPQDIPDDMKYSAMSEWLDEAETAGLLSIREKAVVMQLIYMHLIGAERKDYGLR